MFTLPSMNQIIGWFGWGDGVGALAAISAILTVLVLLAPVVFGLILYGLERVQIKLIGMVNRKFAYFFVNYVTFLGTFVHEMSHLCFGVITGAKVNEICVFENEGGRLGHIGYCTRGPWFMKAVQHSLTSVAPTVVGFTLGYFLLRYIFSGSHTLLEYVGLWYLVISLIDHSTMSDSDLKHYFQGVWIFILPVFLLFFGFGYLG
ncbi:Peptidase M50B-like [Fibrobacter sp. UWT2]|nr:Peptidase M50B-like [Fibrobacter sp. UWT2]